MPAPPLILPPVGIVAPRRRGGGDRRHREERAVQLGPDLIREREPGGQRVPPVAGAEEGGDADERQPWRLATSSNTTSTTIKVW